MSKIMKDNGVKLLAAVMVLVMAFAGVIFISDSSDAEENAVDIGNGVTMTLPEGFTYNAGKITGVASPADSSTEEYKALFGDVSGYAVITLNGLDALFSKEGTHTLTQTNSALVEFKTDPRISLDEKTGLYTKSDSAITAENASTGISFLAPKDNSKVTFTLENDKTLSFSLELDFTDAYTGVAKVGDIGYETFKDARDAAEPGSTITILTDIDFGELTYGIRKAVDINLNGNTITSESTVFSILSDEITIRNGTLKMNYGGSEGYCAILVNAVFKDGSYSPGYLTMTNVTVESTMYGVGVFGMNTGNSKSDGYSPDLRDVTITDSTTFVSTLVLNNCVIRSEAGGFSTNGNYGFENIIVNGGSITSGGCAFYLPSNAKTIVSNCVIKGASGFDQRAGILEINGGSITYTGPGESKEKGDGPVSFGTAIQIVDADGYSHADSSTVIIGTKIDAKGEGIFGDFCFGLNRNSSTTLSIEDIKVQKSTSYRNATLTIDGITFSVKKGDSITTTYASVDELKVGKGTTVQISEDFTIGNGADLMNYGTISVGEGVGVVLSKGSSYYGYDGSLFDGKIFGPNKENSITGKILGSTLEDSTAGIKITGGSIIVDGRVITDSETYGSLEIVVDGENIQISGTINEGVTVKVTEGTVVTVPEGESLVIAENAAIDVDKDSTFRNDGNVTNNGTISGSGDVQNMGTKWEGTGTSTIDVVPYVIKSNDKEYNGVEQTPSAAFSFNDVVWTGVNVIGTYLYVDNDPSTQKLESLDTNYRQDVGKYRACVFLNYTDKITGTVYTNMKLDFIWEITAVDLSKVTINPIPNQDYTGSAIEPTLDITYNGVALELGTDYTVSFDDNINEGQATITVTGKGNYAGTRIINFWIIDMQSYLDALEEWIGGSEGLGKVVPGTENTTYAQVKDVYDAITAAYAGLSNANTPDELGDALDEGKFGILIAIKNEVRHYLQTVYNSGDGYYGRYMSAELYNSSLEAIGPSGAFTPTMVVNAYENALSQRTGLPLDTILSDIESWIGGSEGLGSKVPGSEMTYVETPRIGTAVLNAYSSINSSMTISEAQAALDAAKLNILLETKDYVRHLLQTMYNGGLPYYGMVMTEETYNNALWQISPEGTRYTPTDVVGVVLWAMENRSQSESATLYNNGEVYRVIPYQYSGTPVNIKTAVDAIPAPTMESTSELVTYSFAGWVDENGLAIDFTQVTESFNAYAKYNATVDDTKALLGTDVWFGYMFSDENADPYNTTLPWFTINYQRLVDGVSIQVFIDDEPVFAEPFVGKVNLAAYVLLEIGNEITAGTHTIKISASVSAGEEVVKDEISVKVTVIDYVQVKFIDGGEYVDVQYPVNGTAVTLPTLDDKTGYEFVGWMDKDGKVVGTAGSAYTVDGKTTLTAKYDAIETESKVKLTVGDMIIGTYDKGTWVPVPLYTGTTPANQKFVGYTVTGVDYVAYPAGSVLQMNADVNLIPVFEYTVYQSRQVDDYKLFVQDIGEDKYYVYVLTDKIEGFKNVLSLGTIRMNATDVHNIVFSEVIGKKTVEGVEYGIIWSGEIKSDKAYAQVSLSVLFGNEFIMVDKMTVSPLFNDNYSENGPMSFQIVDPDDAPVGNNYPWLQVNYGRNVDMDTVKLFIDDIEITEIVWVNEDGEPIGTPNTIPANQNAYFQLSFPDGDISPGKHKFTICGTAAEGSVYDMIEMTYQVPDPYGTI